MSPGSKRLLWAVALGAVALVLTLYWRGFHPRLAMLSSVSIAILTYSSFQATERLRRLYRRDR